MALVACFVASLATAQFVPAGREFQVNTQTLEGQYSPAICAAPDGDYVVVWESEAQDGDERGVFGQRYASDGSETQALTSRSGSPPDRAILEALCEGVDRAS